MLPLCATHPPHLQQTEDVAEKYVIKQKNYL